LTDFTDRVHLRLNNTAPDISPLDIVKKSGGFKMETGLLRDSVLMAIAT